LDSARLRGSRGTPGELWAVSSAVEHFLDMEGVTSSILVPPTNSASTTAQTLRPAPLLFPRPDKQSAPEDAVCIPRSVQLYQLLLS
jgi:hypothetical protein